MMTAKDWQERANCTSTDPEAFFPDTGSNGAMAKRVCARCPVAEACLEDALERRDQFGVWGGMNFAERSRILAARGVDIAALIEDPDLQEVAA